MNLTKKFIFGLITGILIIAILNILSFYIFYSSFLKIYLYEKTTKRETITIEYINDILKKKAVDDIENIFSDAELEFFQLLNINEGEIPLNKPENIDIVTNYLIKSGLTPKYIEEIIPTDNFQKVLDSLKNSDTPESKFLKRILISISVTNIVGIFFVILILGIFVRQTISPVNAVTREIKKFNKNLTTSNYSLDAIEYKNKKDEIGLLITAINNLSKRLNIQNQIRTRLLADISHELKTPITSIQCYLEGISDGIIKLDEKNIESINSEMKRLINLVNRMMDFESFDRKNINLNLIKFDVVEVLKSLSEQNKVKLSAKHQKIKIVGENFLEINADKDLFFQVVHNLIGNFYKYAGKNTQLTINVTKKYIDFYDNGKGIKSSEIPFLTEKFYQGNEKSGDAEIRGIGVGLSIVSKIIESHGWKYEIKTDNGKGFSFKIFI